MPQATTRAYGCVVLRTTYQNRLRRLWSVWGPSTEGVAKPLLVEQPGASRLVFSLTPLWVLGGNGLPPSPFPPPLLPLLGTESAPHGCGP